MLRTEELQKGKIYFIKSQQEQLVSSRSFWAGRVDDKNTKNTIKLVYKNFKLSGTSNPLYAFV